MKDAGVTQDENLDFFPKVYSRKTLSVEKKRLQNPDKVSKWKYLASIESEITQIDNIYTEILIGANYKKALEPPKIIASKDGGLYAYQKILD